MGTASGWDALSGISIPGVGVTPAIEFEFLNSWSFMSSATALIWKAAGSPVQPGTTAGICRCCGAPSVGMEFHRWVKDSFNDLDKCHTGEIVCHACLFTFEEQSLTIQNLAGKDKLQKFRNYSYFVLKGQLYVLSKGQKSQIRDVLLQSPEVAIIAVSGQKHIAFRARPGWWQIEEIGVLPFPQGRAKMGGGFFEPIDKNKNRDML